MTFMCCQQALNLRLFIGLEFGVTTINDKSVLIDKQLMPTSCTGLRSRCRKLDLSPRLCRYGENEQVGEPHILAKGFKKSPEQNYTVSPNNHAMPTARRRAAFASNLLPHVGCCVQPPQISVVVKFI